LPVFGFDDFIADVSQGFPAVRQTDLLSSTANIFQCATQNLNSRKLTGLYQISIGGIFYLLK
jgi:hypothetical protein